MSEKEPKSAPSNTNQNRVQLVVGLLAIVGTIIAVGMYLGRLEGRIDLVGEQISKVESDLSELDARLSSETTEYVDRLRDEIQTLRQVIDSNLENELQRPDATRNTEALQRASNRARSAVFIDGGLTSGLNMGVDSSEGRREWANVENGELCMRYPSDQRWGTVFITVGQPTDSQRPGREYSEFSRLLMTARGEPDGTQVWVGMKDSEDPDDGSESRIAIDGLNGSWKLYSFELALFRTADIRRLYVPVEFIFEGPSPSVVCVNAIEFAS